MGKNAILTIRKAIRVAIKVITIRTAIRITIRVATRTKKRLQRANQVLFLERIDASYAANSHCEANSEEDEDVVGVFSHRCSTILHQVIEKDEVSQKKVEKEEPKSRVCKAKGFMYIDVKINRKPIKAMVDIGAIHNYLASLEVERLGLVLEKSSGNNKVINSVAQRTTGINKSVLIKVEEIEEATGPIPKPIRRLLQEFEDVMPEEFPRRLPPRKAIDHEIELILGAKSPTKASYRMAQPELEELRKQLAKILDSGIIVPVKSPYGALVLFQKKSDSFRRMCCDYRALNKITVKNSYSILLVADCFNRLSRAKYYTKIDLRHFTGFLYDFVVVYLDNIVIYSGTLEDHVQHERKVLIRLRENELYAKLLKCLFAQTSISFLGHIIEQGKVRMDSKKVKAIKDWQLPRHVHDVRSFLRLANYYRRFVKGYLEIALPLTELTNKEKAWECQHNAKMPLKN
ncbi:Retrovirus-related Pol polyprotein from transposon 17.6 [Abeliophyllum distichum]|uniref:Retrovirus-related Pol polyprotein from transposon 17.6 n=1 Tax=Abeliophyllum distichum TaxID=126358 RepID=A0ABD1V5X1_9LAMI